MNRTGFTLIELLIVIVIIGILAAIAIPKFSNTKEKAYIASMKADLRNLVTAEEGYFADSTAYTDITDCNTPPAPGSVAWCASTEYTLDNVSLQHRCSLRPARRRRRGGGRVSCRRSRPAALALHRRALERRRRRNDRRHGAAGRRHHRLAPGWQAHSRDVCGPGPRDGPRGAAHSNWITPRRRAGRSCGAPSRQSRARTGASGRGWRARGIRCRQRDGRQMARLERRRDR